MGQNNRSLLKTNIFLGLCKS